MEFLLRKFTASVTAIFLFIVIAIGYSNFQSSSDLAAVPPVSNSENPADLSGYYDQVLSWENCGGGFQCASLTVPLDYANPYAQAISISIIRLEAKNNTLGSLVLNPGGPGGSGIQYTRAAEYVVSDVIRENFDIVGFDPRGVGESSPIECIDDSTTDLYIALDGTPDNAAEVSETIAMLTKFGQDCILNSGDLVGFIDTVSASKDIDILRAALGDEQLNWLGKSYGTFLGATYADLFPQNVGRMLLDGAIDPTLSNLQLSEGQARGFEEALGQFVEYCLMTLDCPLSGSVQDGINQIQKMLNDLDENPAQLNDGREFTQAMGVLGVVGGLYDVSYGWTQLQPMLTAALAGDFSGLAASVDLYTSRNTDGSYSDNSNDAIMAINCLDRPDRGTIEETYALAEKWSEFAPVFGGYLAWSNIACSYWPVAATGVPNPIVARGANPILVVGTRYDPATPYVWAQALAEQLESGILLTLNGNGHTAYRQGSKCIDEIVDTYFLTGAANADVVCSDGL
jgi:pimeloyl-ACP methyl ester carboxylesterase